jgi:hypothetical protein
MLTEQEVKWVISAFLRSPAIAGRGATEEEIQAVVNWAQELKLKAAMNLGLLYEIYRGNIHLTRTEDDVVMSVDKTGIHAEAHETVAPLFSLDNLLFTAIEGLRVELDDLKD